MAINSSLWIDNNALQGAALSAHLASEAMLDDTFDNGVAKDPDGFVAAEGSTGIRHTEDQVWYELSDGVIYNKIAHADSIEQLRIIRVGLIYEDKFEYWSNYWKERYVFLTQRSSVIYEEILSKIEESRNAWFLETKVFPMIKSSFEKNFIAAEDRISLFKAYEYRKVQLLRDEVLFQINGARSIWYLKTRITKQILHLEKVLPIYMQKELVLAFEKRATELLDDVFAKDPVVIGVPVMA